MVGTLISWYIGIVHYNNDLIFTFLNVVTHGIPYMALVWMYNTKAETTQKITKNLPIKVLGIFIFFLIPSIFIK
jgi:hypothetical protein